MLCKVYVFEASLMKFSYDRTLIYPPKEYQEKLKKYRGRKVKVIVIIESE